MQDLITQKGMESMVFTPDMVSESNWAYLNSMELHKSIRQDVTCDPQVTNVHAKSTTTSETQHLYQKQTTQAMSRQSRNHLSQQAAGTSSATNKDQMRQNQSQDGTNDDLEHLEGLIDIDDPRFEQVKQACLGDGIQRADEFCAEVNAGVNRFFTRKYFTYDAIRDATSLLRDEHVPYADTAQITPHIAAMANQPWTFASLPAVNLKAENLASGDSSEQISNLAKKLREKPKLNFWGEPLDQQDNVENFYKGVEEFLKSNMIALICQKNHEHSDNSVSKKISDAIESMIGIAVLSANSDFLVRSLDTVSYFQKNTPKNSKIVQEAFQMCKPSLVHYFGQIYETGTSTSQVQPLHQMHSDYLQGVFGVAKQFSNQRYASKSSSLTSDGEFLYLYNGTSQSGHMYKIMVKENSSRSAGVVYSETHVDKDCIGDLTWTYCKGKLYARKTNAEMGQLLVIDAKTLKKVGEAQLAMNEQLRTNKTLKALNANYPLLSDGEYLYTITFTVERRERPLKEGFKEEQAKLIETKKSDKRKEIELQASLKEQIKQAEKQEESEKKKQGAESKKGPQNDKIGDKNKESLMAQIGASMEDLLPGAKMKSIHDEISATMLQGVNVHAEVVKKLQKEPLISRQNKGAPQHKNAGFERLHDDFRKPVPTMDPSSLKPSGQPNNQMTPAKIYQEMNVYHVCVFSVTKFDISGKVVDQLEGAGGSTCGAGEKSSQYESMTDAELLRDELVSELALSFAGFFTPRECAKALTVCDDDLEDAAALLLERGEANSSVSQIRRVSQTTIAESIIVSPWSGYNTLKSNVEQIQTSKYSVLNPTCIEPGKWTLCDDQVTYHMQDPTSYFGINQIFSLKDDSLKVQATCDSVRKVDEYYREILLQYAPEMPRVWNGDSWKVAATTEAKESQVPSTIEDTLKQFASIKNSLRPDSIDSYESVEEKRQQIAQNEDLLSEWNLYESIKQKSSLLRIVEDRCSIHLYNQNTITFCPFTEKFFAYTIGGAVKNVAVYENYAYRGHLGSFQDQNCKNWDTKCLEECLDFEQFVSQGCRALTWINKRRLALNWRWSSWANNYQRVLDREEQLNEFPFDPTISHQLNEATGPEDLSQKEKLELRNATIKRLKKRANQMKERKVVQELNRLGIEHLSREESIKYREMVKKRQQLQKIEEQKVEQKLKKRQSSSLHPYASDVVPSDIKHFQKKLKAQKDALENKKNNRKGQKMSTGAEKYQPPSKYEPGFVFYQKESEMKSNFASGGGGPPIPSELLDRLNEECGSDIDEQAIIDIYMQQEMMRGGVEGARGRTSAELNILSNSFIPQELKDQIKSGEMYVVGGVHHAKNQQNIQANSSGTYLQKAFDMKNQKGAIVQQDSRENPFFGQVQGGSYEKPQLKKSKGMTGLFGADNQTNKFQSSAVQAAFVLPKEIIQIPKENKKIFQFCPTGSLQSIKSVFSMLTRNVDHPDLDILELLLQQIAFSDQLCSFYEPHTMDQISIFLQNKVNNSKSSQTMTQLIWRIFVMGWNHFVRDAKQAIQILLLFLDHCQVKPTDQNDSNSEQEIRNGTSLRNSSMFQYNENFTPIQLLRFRFFKNRPSFYPFETLKMSKVTKRVFMIQSSMLLEPIQGQNYSVFGFNQKPKVSSNDLPEVDSEKPLEIVMDHKFVLERKDESLKALQSKPRSNESISKVPIEAISLVLQKESDAFGEFPELPISEFDFSMPLYNIFNEEMVDFKRLNGLQVNFENLCAMYSQEKISEQDTSSNHDSQKRLFTHLQNLRDENLSLRQKLFETFLKHILQSVLDADENLIEKKYTNLCMLTIYKGLVERAFAAQDIPSADFYAIQLKIIDESLHLMSKRTNQFKQQLNEMQMSWLQIFRKVIEMTFQNLQMILGTPVQNQIAFQCLPTLLQINEHLKNLFTIDQTSLNLLQEQESQQDNLAQNFAEKATNLLELVSPTNSEGIDSLQEEVFETSHPHPTSDSLRKRFEFPRAIGFFVEIDPRSKFASQNSKLTLYSSVGQWQLNDDFGTFFEFRKQRSIPRKQFFVFGSQMIVEWSSQPNHRKGPAQDESLDGRWGVRLTIKPLMGSPQLLFLLTKNDVLKPVFERIKGDFYTWLATLKLTCIITSHLAQALTSGDLIYYHTSGLLKTGSGVLDLQTSKNGADSVSERSQSAANRSQNTITQNSQTAIAAMNNQLATTQTSHYGGGGTGVGNQSVGGFGMATHTIQKAKRDSVLENIFKSGILNWHIFKSGVRAPTIENLTHEQLLSHSFALLDEKFSKTNENALNSLYELSQIQMLNNGSNIINIESQKLTENGKKGLKKVLSSVSLQKIKSTTSDISQRGGTHKQGLFRSQKDLWSEDVREYFEPLNQAQDIAVVGNYSATNNHLSQQNFGNYLGMLVLKKLRKMVPETIQYRNTFIMPRNKPLLPKWREVETTLIAAMLYHSGAIGDCKKFLKLTDKVCQEFSKTTPNEDLVESRQAEAETSLLVEEFILIGRQLNVLLAWMLSRLEGQKLFNMIIEDTVQIAQEKLNIKLEKKRILMESLQREQQEREQMTMAEQETRQFLYELEYQKLKKQALKIQEDAQKVKQTSDEKQAQSSQQKKSATKYKSSGGGIVKGTKRANVSRLAPVKLPKPQKKKVKKEQPKNSQDEEVKEENKSEIDEKEGEKVDILEPPVKVQITTKNTKSGAKEEQISPDSQENVQIIADLTIEELIEFKNSVSATAFSQLMERYQNLEDMQNLLNLCVFFNIEFNNSDINETLKAIFRRVKTRMAHLVDFEDESAPVNQELNMSQIELGSPIEEVARDVLNRLQFLFEVVPSANFLAEVTKIVPRHPLQISNKSKRMTTIAEDIEEDAMSQAQQATTVLTEHSDASQSKENANMDDLSDSDSEELTPIQAQRSMSMPVSTPGFAHLRGGSSKASDAPKFDRQRKLSMEYSEWVEGYRKWRLWNKRAPEEAEDLLSPYGSPLQAVVAFAKTSQIYNINKLRNVLLDQKLVAHARLYGLKYQIKLFQTVKGTILSRHVQGYQSKFLKNSPLNSVETSGESVTKVLNETSRSFVQLCMNEVVKISEKAFIIRKSIANAEFAQAQSSTTQIQDQSANGNGQAIQQATLKQKDLLTDYYKQVVHLMNDLRIHLNNVYTREYVLESVRQDQQIQTRDTLGIDQIRAFIKTTINLIVVCNEQSQLGKNGANSKQKVSALTRIKQILGKLCKVVLHLFTDKEKASLRQNETQRILQQTILGALVDQLDSKMNSLVENQSYTSDSSYDNDSSSTDLIQLLQILAELIQGGEPQQFALSKTDQGVSQSEFNEEQNPAEIVKQSVSSSQSRPKLVQQSLLMAGSKQVTHCSAILAMILVEVKVPAVIKLAVKCAEVFFRLIDFDSISYDSTQEASSETDKKERSLLDQLLQTIGYRIANCNQENESLANDQESNKSQQESKSDRQYYVCANLNMPKEEDFTFILTALWNWHYEHPINDLELVRDVSEITQIVPALPKNGDPIIEIFEAKKPRSEKLDAKQDDLLLDLEEEKKEDISELDKNKEIDAAYLRELVKREGSIIKAKEVLKRKHALQQSSKTKDEKFSIWGKEQCKVDAVRKMNRVLDSQYENRITDDKLSEQIRKIRKETTDQNESKAALVGLQRHFNESFQRGSANYYANAGRQKLGQPGAAGRNQAGATGAATQAKSSDKIENLKSVLEQIVNLTFVKPTSNDSLEKQEERRNEMNYNLLLQKVVSMTVKIASKLYSSHTAKVAGPLSREDALKFSALLEKAYAGNLQPIVLNPFMRKEKMGVKVSQPQKIAIQDIFPITGAKVKKFLNSERQQKTQIKTIHIAPKRCVVFISEEGLSQEISRLFDSKNKEVNYQLTRSSSSKQATVNIPLQVVKKLPLQNGASTSIIIQELINLVQSLLFGNQSIVSQRQLHGLRQKRFIDSISQSLKKINLINWNNGFSDRQRTQIVGSLAILGGWYPSLHSGQHVQVKIGNVENKAIVIDQGHGTGKVSIILDDDESMQIKKVKLEQVNPVKIHLKPTIPLDSQALLESIMNLSKAMLGQDDNHSLKQSKNQLQNPEFILNQLLKMSSTLPNLTSTLSQTETLEFFETMLDLIQNKKAQNFREGKSVEFWESEFARNWEFLVDKTVSDGFVVFQPREFPEVTGLTIFSNQDQLISKKKTTKDELLLKALLGESPAKKTKDIAIENLSLAQYSDGAYIQKMNSYLHGLPEFDEGTSEKVEEKLKLLAYWEKHIIPRTIEHIIRYNIYEAHSIKPVLSQIRYYLKNGFIKEAVSDISTLFRADYVNLPIPGADHDWSAKIIDEVYVDQWVLAKICPNSKQIEQKKSSKYIKDRLKTQISENGLIDKLQRRNLTEILVQIKAVNGKSNMVLCEYSEEISLKKYWIWFSIQNLKTLEHPVRPITESFLFESIQQNFILTLKNLNESYAKQTILQIFSSTNSFENLNLSKGKLHFLQDIISWAVLENLSHSPIVGILDQFDHAIMPSNSDDSQQKRSFTDLAKSMIAKTKDNPSLSLLSNLLSWKQDQIAYEMSNKKAFDSQQSSSTSQESQFESKLDLVVNLLKWHVQRLTADDEKNEQETEKTESNRGSCSKELISELVDWTITNWFILASELTEEKAIVDIIQQYQNRKSTFTSEDNNQATQQGKSGLSQVIALHELLPQKIKSPVATLIMFKEGQISLPPLSKVQFYADQSQTKLIHEIVPKQETLTKIGPLMLNETKIWVNFVEGSNGLADSDDEGAQAKMQCAIFQIPKEWTIFLWLSESLTQALLSANLKNNGHFVAETIGRLLSAIIVFFEESKAPSIMSGVILRLISRLIIKLRYIYQEIEYFVSERTASEEVQKFFKSVSDSSHFERLFLTSDFVQSLLSQLVVHVESEQHSIESQQRRSKDGQTLLFNAFVQDSVEFLMVALVPTFRDSKIHTVEDLLPKGSQHFELPDWLNPLIKVTHFLHYFRGEMHMISQIAKEVHQKATRDHLKYHMDNIVVLRQIPRKNSSYPQKWILQKIIELLQKHQVRLVDPIKDIIFVEDLQEQQTFTCVLFIDSFSEKRREDHEPDEDGCEDQMLQLLYADSDEENEEDSGQEIVKEQKDETQIQIEELKKKKEAGPTEYICGACTFLNRMANQTCEICMSPRPPQAQIVDEFNQDIQQQINDLKGAAKSNNQQNSATRNGEAENDKGSDQEEVTLHRIRLKMLAKDLRHMISHEQHQKYLQEVHERQKEQEKAKQDKNLLLKQKLAQEKGEENKSKQHEEMKDKDEAEIDKKQNFKEEKANENSNDQQNEEQEWESASDSEGTLHDSSSSKEMFEELPDRLMRRLSEPRNSPIARPKSPKKEVQEGQISNDGSLVQDNSAQNDKNSEKSKEESKSEEIDLDNLPEDRVQRWQLLGIDLSLLDFGGDGDDFFAVVEQSQIEQILKVREAKEAQRKEQEIQLRKEEEQRQKEELKRAEKSLKIEKEAPVKISVIAGYKEIFLNEENNMASIVVQDVMRMRVSKDQNEDGKDFEFNELTLKALEQVHQNYRHYELDQLLSLPKNEPFLEDFELSAEWIKENSFEEFKEKMFSIVFADSRLFFKIMIAFGYDFWMNRVCLPSFKSASERDSVFQSLNLLKSVKYLIDCEFVQGSTTNQEVDPSQIRILSFMQGLNSQESTHKSKENEEKESELTLKQLLERVDPINLSSNFGNINANMVANLKAKLDLADLRFCWALLQEFNRVFAQAVPYIQQPEDMVEISQKARPMSIAAYMNYAKELGLSTVKTTLRQMILDKTALQVGEPPVLIFERLRIAGSSLANSRNIDDRQDGGDNQQKEQDQDSTDQQESSALQASEKTSQEFMFKLAYEQLKELNIARLRPKKPMGADPHLAFKIRFKGEHVEGDGGPYRQFFEDISQEMQPGKLQRTTASRLLGLLQPCTNQRDSEMVGKDLFVVDSSKVSSTNLSHFTFLGLLMGVCIRTGAILSLNLPKFVWKRLVDQHVTLDDLKEIELRFVKQLEFALNASQADLEENPLYWETTLADGNKISLLEQGNIDGSKIKVDYEKRFEFVEKSLKAHLLQGTEQIRALKRGISQVVPTAILNISTYEELQMWVCGMREVDIDLLKRHTTYSSTDSDYSEDSKLIKTFWHFLRSISEEERRKFIKFCWGQERLPASEEAYQQSNVRMRITPFQAAKNAKKTTHNQDKLLPKASTCFFNLELPKYSSFEVMKERILLAINLDNVSMNAEDQADRQDRRDGRHRRHFDDY